MSVVLSNGTALPLPAEPWSADPHKPTMLAPSIGVAKLKGVPLLVGVGDPYKVVAVVSEVEGAIEKFDVALHACVVKYIVPESSEGWCLRGGDWWRLDYAGFASPPGAMKRLQAANLLLQALDLDWLANSPRLRHFVHLHGDGGLPGDAGWLRDNWPAYAGFHPLRGWYAPHMPRGGDGYNNCHYEALLWMGLAYFLDPNAATWWHFISAANIHATMGRIHAPAHRDHGRARTEKGHVLPGDLGGASWAKQWSIGLALAAYLSEDPVIAEAFAESMRAVTKWSPAQAWDGSWGERTGANYLRELNLATRLGYQTPEKGLQAVDTFLGYLDPATGVWPQKPPLGPSQGPSSAGSSPWMASKAPPAMMEACDLAGEPLGSPRRGRILDAAQAVFDAGFYRASTGEWRCYYRMPPYHDADVNRRQENPAQVGISVPMLRLLAQHRGHGAYDEARAWIDANAGSGWGRPARPISDIKLADGPNGPGWVKASKMFACGVRL